MDTQVQGPERENRARSNCQAQETQKEDVWDLGVQRGNKTQSVTAFHTLGGDRGINGAQELLPELWAEANRSWREYFCQFSVVPLPSASEPCWGAVFYWKWIEIQMAGESGKHDLQSHTAKSKPAGLKLNHNGLASTVGHPYFPIRFQLLAWQPFSMGFPGTSATNLKTNKCYTFFD